MHPLRRGPAAPAGGRAGQRVSLPEHARGTAPLFTLADPRGDDHGDGELRYPRARTWGRATGRGVAGGVPGGGGTRFEATFARPIAKPSRRGRWTSRGSAGAERARFGFYTFNLDLYVDTDRVEGSGRTDTLPGRNLTLAPGIGWEKAILLTPRPYERAGPAARGVAAGGAERRAEVSRAWGQAAQREVEAAVERELTGRVFFPTLIRVRGDGGVLGAGRLLWARTRPEWGYGVAVTGASFERCLSWRLFGGVTAARAAMVMPIVPGESKELLRWRAEGDASQSPVVDLVVPPGVTQEQVLGPTKPPWPAVVPRGGRGRAAPDAGHGGGRRCGPCAPDEGP